MTTETLLKILGMVGIGAIFFSVSWIVFKIAASGKVLTRDEYEKLWSDNQ